MVATRGTPHDVIRPGPGIGDPLPEPHDVIGRSAWGETLSCRCGVLAHADHERAAWIGVDDHVLPFGPGRERFEPGRPPDADEEYDAEQQVEAVRERRGSAVAQIMSEFGLVDRDLGTYVPPTEHEAGTYEPPSAPETAQEAPVSLDDPYGAVAGRERARMDARNERDRERRLRARQDAEHREPGRRWQGFRPKGR